ncbi:hypothetical protein MLD38_038785 [Melastoma candidum]|uniref:Uncharacterized protein n=1 Tax=Melastoma candidum TaxID=119954 RepID=A0ACB9L005_9MYRT|nr:hypothetical protein MLD38_038785 [Melastoma candidum]
MSLLLISLAQQPQEQGQQFVNELIGPTCRSMPFPGFCISIFQSDYRSARARTQKDLAWIIVDHTMSKAREIANKAHPLMLTLHPPSQRLRDALMEYGCQYRSLRDHDLELVYIYFHVKEFKKAGKTLDGVADQAEELSKLFTGMDNPLKNDHEFFLKAVRIAMVIVGSL